MVPKVAKLPESEVITPRRMGSAAVAGSEAKTRRRATSRGRMGAQASTSNASGAPSPDEVCGHSREGETETREAVQGIGDEGGDDDGHAHGDEGERRHGVPRHGVGALVAAGEEEAPGGGREKDQARGHAAAGEWRVGAGERGSDGGARPGRRGNRRG